MRIFLLLIGLFLWQINSSTAQNWQIKAVSGLNSAYDEIPALEQNQEFFFYSNREKDLLHEEDWKLRSKFHLYLSPLQTSFSELSDPSLWKGEMQLPFLFDAVCKSPNLKSWAGIQQEKSGTKIYSIQFDDDGRISVTEIAYLNYQIYHISPTDVEGDFIVSYRDNSNQNTLDIGLLQLDGSQSLILPIEGVNTDFNEAFPVWHQGDLYFSSNREGQFDIYLAEKQDQWLKVEKLKSPLNSEFDDHSIYFLNDDKGFLASNRTGGKGGDDIYLFERIDELALSGYTGRLSIKDQGIRDVPIRIYNDLGEVIAEGMTDENGNFDFPAMSENQNFKVVPVTDPKVLAASKLQISNPEGTVIQEVLADSNGHFYFEFLPYLNPGGLSRLDNPDLSTLFGIRIEGKVLKVDSTAVDEGELIVLMNDIGDPQQITYTEDDGSFLFEEVSPKANYSLGVQAGSEAVQIQIKGAAEAIHKNEEGDFDYQRILPGDYKTLKLSDGTVIEIQSGESLILKKIEYEFNEWVLNDRARAILSELAGLSKLNPGIKMDVISHTDSRGTSQYNLELSKKRANSAIEYLKSIGMRADTVFGTGVGESQLLNGCDDNSDCSEEKHAENRRTEVILRVD